VVVAATLLSLFLLWRVERARSRQRAAEQRAQEERGRLVNKILSMAERQRSGMAAEVQSLRRIMATLRPPVLEERGLVSALSDYVEVVRQQAGISCTPAARLPGRLPEDTEIVLYRVAQEALTNEQAWASRTGGSSPN
jgi:signal transduction histidine kinase